MIEGLIILGIAAIVIVVALFGTTIISILTSIAASISAMITGAVTGTATLLTSWYTWAIASDITNYYIGYIGLVSWLSLFAYSGYKIATSDKKKWMNLVGRGSNYLGVILILFLVAQPIVVSFGASYLADTTSSAIIDYNITENIVGSSNVVSVAKTNATSQYWETQSITYDNATYEVIVPSADFDTVTAATAGRFMVEMNITFLADIAVTNIKIDYFYVGTGNLTSVIFQKYLPAAGTMKTWETTTNNASLTWAPEPFQAQQLKATTEIRILLMFEDSSNLPSDTDYLSVAMTFYKSTTVFTQETIMFWLAVSIAALDIIGLLFATGVLQKYIL